MKQGFITLLSSEDYLDATLVLAYSLQQVKSQYPLVVAITDNLKNNINIIQQLKKYNCIIEFIPKLEYSNQIQEKFSNHTVLNTASKISIFKLTHWDKLIYIDSDILILQNIDELFNYPDGSMLYVGPNPDSPLMGISSLFVFEPHNHEEYNMLLFLISNYPCLDGDLLGHFWFHVKTDFSRQIPISYLTQYDDNLKYRSNIKAVHFANEIKPWKELEPFKQTVIGQIYISYLTQIKNHN